MMMEVTFEQLCDYIELNILHSEAFDSASDTQKQKAFNQAKITLLELRNETLTIVDLSEQVLWLFRLNEYTQMAEVGITGSNIDGISYTAQQQDNRIAKSIVDRHGLAKKRRKAARIAVNEQDSSFVNFNSRRTYRGWY